MLMSISPSDGDSADHWNDAGCISSSLRNERSLARGRPRERHRPTPLLQPSTRSDLCERGHPVTIFLNDKGVFLGSKAHANRIMMDYTGRP